MSQSNIFDGWTPESYFIAGNWHSARINGGWFWQTWIAPGVWGYRWRPDDA